MGAFWCITLGFIILRDYIKSHAKEAPKNIKPEPEPVKPVTYAIEEQSMEEAIEDAKAEVASQADELQKERDCAELRKQGFTEELITVIIPTINNGK